MKRVFSIFIVFMTSYQVFGQSNIGFFHLKNATPQNSNYNAAWFPESKVFVSLPGISGIDFTLNNSFGIADVFTETGDSTLVDINRFLSVQDSRSFLNASLTITDLMVGYRIDESSFVTLFINERTDGTLFYPVDFMNFLWQGNAAYIGDNFVSDDITYDVTHYREWGAGYGRSFNILGFNTDVGIRLKYLTGIFHSSIEDNLSVGVLTREEDYSLELTMDGLVRSAGVDLVSGNLDEYSYAVFNQNSGFGVDFGVNMDVTDKLSVGLAVNDLGFIRWKEQTQVTDFNGVRFTFEGMDLDDLDQLAQAVEDSIDALGIDTVAADFTTTLNSRTFLTGSYQVTESGYVQATLSNYFTQGQAKSAFGVGYLHQVKNWLAASLTATAASQSGVDLGAAVMLRGGFFQFYLAMDNILNTISVPEASGVNFKFGINFLFGQGGGESGRDDGYNLEDYY